MREKLPAAFERPPRRDRPAREPRRQPGEDLRADDGVARPVGVDEAALQGLGRRAVAGERVLGVRTHPPGAREPAVVAQRFELGHDLVREPEHLRHRAVRPDDVHDVHPLDPRAELDPPVSRGGAALDHAAEELLGRRELALLGEGPAEDELDLRQALVVLRQQPRCAREELRGRRHVPALAARSPADASQRAARGGRDRVLVRPAPELCVVAARLLQVIAEDLLLLDQPFSGHLLEPAREAAVQIRAHLLRDRRIRRVADQEVAEAVGVGAGDRAARRLQELLADEACRATSRSGSPWRTATASRWNTSPSTAPRSSSRRSCSGRRSRRAARSAWMEPGA